jgi:hypothetical protein
MKRKLAVLAAAALLIGTVATGAEARGAHFSTSMGFHGGQYMGGTISTPPVFNPSSGYTVPTSPEAPVSPASPGSLFH